MPSNVMSYSDDEDDYQDNSPFLEKKKPTPLWDSFQDPPPDDQGESASGWHGFEFLTKAFKLFVYLVVFSVILFSSILSKSTYLLMAAHIKPKTVVKYCNRFMPKNEFYASIPEVQRIAWIWALVFAFAAPEVFTFLRAARICFFKNVKRPKFSELFLIGFMETMHVIGLGLLTFFVLPNINSVQGLMITNCICFVPALLSLVPTSNTTCKSLLLFFVSIFAVCAQATGFITWPLLGGRAELWAIVPALILISFRWWENYISSFVIIPCLRRFAEIRQCLSETRYFTYLLIAPWKVFIFLGTAIATDGENVSYYFGNFSKGWSVHNISVETTLPLYSDRAALADSTSSNNNFLVESVPNALLWILVIQIFTSYLSYVFAKFACKIRIQIFSFSIPLNLTVPVGIGVILTLTGVREENVCALHGFLPDYLAWKGPSIYHIWDYILNDFAWVWMFWCLSQAWVTRHIWFPENDKNAHTEKLFIAPWYCGLLVDQCIVLNRRRFDHEEEMINTQAAMPDNPTDIKVDSDILPSDHIPLVYVCATMWHENKDEMMEFLKSVLRLDEDQCARRMVRKHMKTDVDYYELEIHIFFDDAFVLTAKEADENTIFFIDPENPPVNKYVKLLVDNIQEAAMKIYKSKVRIASPLKIKTPYGGRLVWTLPGGTKMIAHLKNKNKIRHKKRWSQVMYMYYILGFRIMDMEASVKRKSLIAENTFLLALDGDIDFQPEAVHLLIGQMKVDRDLGAACGRIHPVGRGPMVWYQKFEYSIGHWLQKATEHVIGCVLCSPGCFSLFRGRALMEDSVMKKYTTTSTEARHYVQYDQGEDRWLCTLILKQTFSVRYSAAADAYTHAPENFGEFYKQRRRWVPSTIANILDLLSDAKTIVENNNSISTPYIFYQGMLMAGTILGPGTIFLMMVGSLVSVFNIDIWTSFLWNFIPILAFMLICYFAPEKYQLIAAFLISTLYSLVMMAVLIGIIMQVIDDGIMSPPSLFFLSVAVQIVITGLLHPRETKCLIYGLVYYITIPSMYLLLLVYSLFNMNDVSWGTRDDKPPPSAAKQQNNNVPKQKQGRLQKIMNLLKPVKDVDGSFDISCSGVFRCMFCTHPKTGTEQTQLLLINEQLSELNNKLKTLEMKLSGEIVVMAPKQNEVPINIDMDNQAHDEENDIREVAFQVGWFGDPELKTGPMDSLTLDESVFWAELIKRYLKPLVLDEEAQDKVKKDLCELRDVSVFAFVMMNSLFVLVVFLLQLNKDELHIQWPFNANYTIEFQDNEVKINPDYLQLEPIGSLFVFFFGLILGIQFIGMLIHRFATVSEILASTSLNFFSSDTLEDPDTELRACALDAARFYQRPRHSEYDEEVDTADFRRRNTIARLHSRKSKDDGYTNLERNFNQNYFEKEDTVAFKHKGVRRKTVKALEEHRKSVCQQRRATQLTLRKTKNNFNNNNFKDNRYSTSNSGNSNNYSYDNHGFAPALFDTEPREANV